MLQIIIDRITSELRIILQISKNNQSTINCLSNPEDFATSHLKRYTSNLIHNPLKQTWQTILQYEKNLNIHSQQYLKQLTMTELPTNIYQWLSDLGVLPPLNGSTQKTTIDESLMKKFFSGNKISEIVSQIFKKRGEEPPETLKTMKKDPQPAGQLYNWNLLNQSIRKLGLEIDSDMKTAIMGGQWSAIEFILQQLKNSDEAQTSHLKESNSYSHKQQSPKTKSPSQKPSARQKPKAENIDILDYVINTLSTKLKLTKKQAIALIADNNRYLAYVFVKGVKNSYQQIQQILQIFYEDLQMVVEKIVQSHDVCDFFLQMIKPSILSKSQEIAMWGCKILSETADELMKKELLPLGYEWLIKQNGGLSTAILCLLRHPKLSENVVNFILQFGRFNISELLTVQLKKFCTDTLSYLKFLLQIFDPVVESNISSEELLNSGALDYWIEQAEKGADNDARNSAQLRVVSVEILCKIWKAYPLHIQDTLGLANNIMTYFKKGIRDSSQIIRLNLLEQLFELLIHFARQKSPFASVIYKKLTFMFIENHQLTDFRQMVLRNFENIFSTFSSIPVDIFLQPFAKQLKISEGKTYILNVSDLQFIIASIQHHKLKPTTAVQLIDFLCKTFLNNPVFWKLSYDAIQILAQRFISDQTFLDYCTKLVKVCLALFISSMKLRKSKDDQTRLAMQKRSQIITLLLMFIRLENPTLNQQIKILTTHTKIQIKQQYKYQHDGITQILQQFGNIYEIQKQVINQSKIIAAEKDKNLSELQQDSKVINSTQPLKLPPINYRPQDDNMSEVSKSRKSNLSGDSRKRHDFPMKDYTEFQTQEERAFLKQHGIGLKKKIKQSNNSMNARMHKQFNIREAIKDSSIVRQRRDVISNTAKAMQQIDKIKEKKQQQQMKRAKQQQIINKKKEILKQKIKKQMQQRTVAVGKINDKNVQARIFQQNQINQKLLVDHQMVLNNMQQQEDRDSQSLDIVFKKYFGFLKKLFTKYQNASQLKKKQVFDQNGQLLHFISQVDCIRMFKEKGIERDKTVIQQMLKLIIKKADIILGVNFDHFVKLLEQYAIYSYNKSHLQSLGDNLKQILKKMAQGQNFKLEEDEDDLSRELTAKIRYDPQTEIPTGFKKITQRQYHLKSEITYLNKQILPESFVYAYEIINQIINERFNTKTMELAFAAREELRVVKKAGPPQPPRMAKRDDVVEEQKEKPIVKAGLSIDKSATRSVKIPSIMKRQAKTVQRRLNSVEKKKRETEEERKVKQQQQEKVRKARALQLKKKLDQQTEERRKEREKKLEQDKQKKRSQQQKLKKQKLQKEQYLKDQKQKIQKYKRQQQQNQADVKKKKEEQERKVQESRKQALKISKKRKDQKTKQQEQNSKKLKQQKQIEQKQKKEQDEKRKQLAKKQVKKKIQSDKQKLQNDRSNKQILKKLYEQKSIQQVFTSFKQQLKALYSFGTEFNDIKVGTVSEGIQSKGWLMITQAFHLCDLSTATLIYKNLPKQHGTKCITFDILQQNMLNFSAKNIVGQLKDNYQELVTEAGGKLKHFIEDLGIPKQKPKHKQFFQKIKTSKRAQKSSNDVRQEEKQQQKQDQQINQVDTQNLQKLGKMQVVNPKGQKQTWGVK